MPSPVINTIILVEDRIAEILESGKLRIRRKDNGLPTVEYIEIHRKNSFLIGLSKDLELFHSGRY